MPAFLLALEGGEGTGKSTQAALLVAALTAAGHEVVATREPGAGRVGAVLREQLLDPALGPLDPRAEALLYAADRAEHVARLVRPALARGAVVVTDRFVDSSLAYQGVARGLGVAAVGALSAFATGGLVADLVVLLDLDPAVGLARAEGTPDRLEAEPMDFHHRVREAFLTLAAGDPAGHVVVDAARDPAAVHADVWAAVTARLAAGATR